MNNLPEWLEEPVVTGATIDNNQVRVTISDLPNSTELITKIFEALSVKSQNIDMITSMSENDHLYITFTVVEGNLKTIKETLSTVFSGIDGWKMVDDSNVSKISVVGVGMRSSYGVAARFFSALSKANVHVLATTTSEIKISVLVSQEDSSKAIKAIIDEFKL